MENNEEFYQQPAIDVASVESLVGNVKAEIGKVIIGQYEVLDLLLISLLTQGHVLLEGVPGIAKTLCAKLLAKTADLKFSRIQFTPDLMPADVIGTSVFNVKNSEFFFNRGPVFAQIVLIDEINRAPAKTQSALFEVMEERQVTVDGTTYPMEFPYFVIATQNPIEQEGTYRLPEAQLDRFLFRIKMDYPNAKEEKEILMRFKDDFNYQTSVVLKEVVTKESLKKAQHVVEQVYIQDELLNYIANIVSQTRNHPDLFLGASPRASLAIMRTAKAVAAMNGRTFVVPDDIQYVADPVLNHRIIITPDREMEGMETKDVIQDIIKKLEVPR